MKFYLHFLGHMLLCLPRHPGLQSSSPCLLRDLQGSPHPRCHRRRCGIVLSLIRIPWSVQVALLRLWCDRYLEFRPNLSYLACHSLPRWRFALPNHCRSPPWKCRPIDHDSGSPLERRPWTTRLSLHARHQLLAISPLLRRLVRWRRGC